MDNVDIAMRTETAVRIVQSYVCTVVQCYASIGRRAKLFQRVQMHGEAANSPLGIQMAVSGAMDLVMDTWTVLSRISYRDFIAGLSKYDQFNAINSSHQARSKSPKPLEIK